MIGAALALWRGEAFTEVADRSFALPETARSAVNPLHPSVVSITQVNGSTAPNVIPGTASAAGTVRLMHESDRTRLHERLARTVTSIADRVPTAWGRVLAVAWVLGTVFVRVCEDNGLLGESGEMPSGEQLADEFERFLADQDRKRPRD